MSRTRARRRFTLFCCLVVLVPLTVDKHAGRELCVADAVVLLLPASAPRTALRVARLVEVTGSTSC